MDTMRSSPSAATCPQPSWGAQRASPSWPPPPQSTAQPYCESTYFSTPSLCLPVSSIVRCLNWLPSSSFPPSSFSLRFLSHPPHRRNALRVYDALQFTESVGIYELISHTATLISRYCPHSADDEIKAVGDEVTCLKIHSHVAAEAGGDPRFFSASP